MTDNEKIVQAVLESIDELNEQLPKEDRLEKSIDTELFGSDGKLDSLGLVSLVTTVEQKIEEVFGVSATMLEGIADLESENPFRTVQTMADYISSTLESKAN